MASTSTPGFRLRSLLPVEHGSWVFLFLPMLVGALKAPSLGGLGLGLLSLAVFLLRTPLQRWSRLQWNPGLRIALGGLGALACLGTGLAFRHGGLKPLLVLAAGGLALMPALAGAARRRALVPELLAAVGSSLLLPATLLAGGWTLKSAGVACGIFLLTLIPPFLFIRQVVVETHKVEVPTWELVLLHGSHLLACGLGLWAWRLGWTALVLPVWMAGLWVRTLLVPRTLPIRKVGWLEAVISCGHLVTLGLGLRML